MEDLKKCVIDAQKNATAAELALATAHAAYEKAKIEAADASTAHHITINGKVIKLKFVTHTSMETYPSYDTAMYTTVQTDATVFGDKDPSQMQGVVFVGGHTFVFDEPVPGQNVTHMFRFSEATSTRAEHGGHVLLVLANDTWMVEGVNHYWRGY